MGYWLAGVALIGFGILGAMSIGRAFFLLGTAMLVLGPLQRWATVSGLADPGRALNETNLIALGIGAATFAIMPVSLGRLRPRSRDEA